MEDKTERLVAAGDARWKRCNSQPNHLTANQEDVQGPKKDDVKAEKRKWSVPKRVFAE